MRMWSRSTRQPRWRRAVGRQALRRRHPRARDQSGVQPRIFRRLYADQSRILLHHHCVGAGVDVPDLSHARRRGRYAAALARLVARGRSGRRLPYLFAHAFDIALRGWEMAPPPTAVYFSFALWILVLEAGRRAGGLPLAIIVGILSLIRLHPVLARCDRGVPVGAKLHGGLSRHGLGNILGIPLRTFAELIVGFILFGAALHRPARARLHGHFLCASR